MLLFIYLAFFFSGPRGVSFQTVVPLTPPTDCHLTPNFCCCSEKTQFLKPRTSNGGGQRSGATSRLRLLVFSFLLVSSRPALPSTQVGELAACRRSGRCHFVPLVHVQLRKGFDSHTKVEVSTEGFKFYSVVKTKSVFIDFCNFLACQTERLNLQLIITL